MPEKMVQSLCFRAQISRNFLLNLDFFALVSEVSKVGWNPFSKLLILLGCTGKICWPFVGFVCLGESVDRCCTAHNTKAPWTRSPPLNIRET